MSTNTTIFLVEDDPMLIDIYTTKFKEAGFEVQVAKSGEEALEAFPNIHPRVIVMDIVLPRVDGWQLLEAVSQHENLKDSKVIVLSNLGQKEEIEKGSSLGADLYLIKAHFTPSQVVQEVQNLLAS